MSDAIPEKLDELIRWTKREVWNGLSDNRRFTYHELKGNLTAGQAKRYDFPPWARNYYVENLDGTDTAGTSGYLYVWYNFGENGTKQLPTQAPQLYESLVTQGDFVSEHSKYEYLMVMPDSSATAPEYVVKFTGRKVDDFED